MRKSVNFPLEDRYQKNIMRPVENFVKFDFGSALTNSEILRLLAHHHHSQDFESNLQETVFSPKKEQHGYSQSLQAMNLVS